jgi:hypothetical protein
MEVNCSEEDSVLSDSIKGREIFVHMFYCKVFKKNSVAELVAEN